MAAGSVVTVAVRAVDMAVAAAAAAYHRGSQGGIAAAVAKASAPSCLVAVGQM